jgi:hypothetical protein
MKMLAYDGEARTMSPPVRPIGTIALASTLLASGLEIGLPANVAFAVDWRAAPDSPAPPNGHWYYRTDRTDQRKCWYLRANTESSEQKAVQVAPEAPLKTVSQAAKYSLSSFKEFMAQNGGAKLSDQEVEKLYAKFLEWRRRANN